MTGSYWFNKLEEDLCKVSSYLWIEPWKYPRAFVRFKSRPLEQILPSAMGRFNREIMDKKGMKLWVPGYEETSENVKKRVWVIKNHKPAAKELNLNKN